MTRRIRETNGEAMVRLAALLPWWLSLLLAVLSYVTLSAYASRPIAMTDDPSSIPFFQFITKGLATAGQYILPIVLVVGGVVSWFGQRHRKKRFDQVADWPVIETINHLSWQEFEQLIGEVFRKQGFSVSETGQSGPDGGVDLELRNDRELHLVQCKQWRAQRVGVSVVRELAGVIAARGAAGGYVVTSGAFTPDAEAFAKGSNIQLIAGNQLTALLAKAKQSLPQEPVFPPIEESHPSCPVCGASMVIRTAKKGVQSGRSFWGCTQFPNCRGTVNVD